MVAESSSSPSSNPNAGKGAPRAGGEPDLQVELSKLRSDLESLSDSVKTLAADRANSYRSQAFALRDDVSERGERYMRQAQEAVNELESNVTERIREEPLKSVLIAAAVGYLYARLFR